MAMRITRKTAVKTFAAAAAGTAAQALGFSIARAQAEPIKIGLLTILTGPLAFGGIQCRQGIELFLKEKNYTLAGRKIELIVADTGGNPAGAKTKAQELIERDRVDFIIGPFAAFEILAISDYLIQHKMPTMAMAGAIDLTARTPNPFLIRASATSAQAMYPLADYAAKVMKLKNVTTICDDFAFGYEQVGGFQQVFAGDGGRVIKKLWSPLATPDYTPYLVQIQGGDGVVQGLTGSNPVKFMQQYASYGLKGKYPVLGGETAADDALLKSFTAEDAVGMINSCPYSLTYNSPSNKRFVAAMQRTYDDVPGLNAATYYIYGMCVEEALKKTGGRVDDKTALVKALRSVSLADSPRGPFHFDEYGNIVGNIFIRRIDRVNGKLVNTIVKTYPNVSQFWTFDPKQYLATPPYTRDANPPILAQHG
jgi:branched-chain amino acid transport system substrate-binding protein